MSLSPFGDYDPAKGRRRRLTLGFGALLLLALLFAALVGNALRAADRRSEAERWHLHTFEVLLTIEALESAANEGIRGERGYVITGDAAFLEPYFRGRGDAPVLIARLARQTRDNPAQQRHMGPLRAEMTRLFGVLASVVALREQGRTAEAVATVRRGAGRRNIEALLAGLNAMRREEQRLLAVRSALDARADGAIERYDFLLAGVGLLLLAIAASAGVSTVRSQRRVRAMAEQLRHSAATDELTGLANRRSFVHALGVELARAGRSGAPLAVAVADLDHFKRVNDSHGHAGGDAVLRYVARIAAETMRAGDLVGRMGGEEFAILMPDTSEDAAEAACERLRAAIERAPMRVDGAEVKVTLSTGIAVLANGDDGDTLVRRADRALYRAKEGGRNQVRLAA